MPRLILYHLPSSQEHIIALPEENPVKLTVGRDETNNIVLPEAWNSRKHLTLTTAPKGVAVEVIGRNGLRLEDGSVKRPGPAGPLTLVFEPGERFYVGPDYCFEIAGDESDAPSNPSAQEETSHPGAAANLEPIEEDYLESMVEPALPKQDRGPQIRSGDRQQTAPPGSNMSGAAAMFAEMAGEESDGPSASPIPNAEPTAESHMPPRKSGGGMFDGLDPRGDTPPGSVDLKLPGAGRVSSAEMPAPADDDSPVPPPSPYGLPTEPDRASPLRERATTEDQQPISRPMSQDDEEAALAVTIPEMAPQEVDLQDPAQTDAAARRLMRQLHGETLGMLSRRGLESDDLLSPSIGSDIARWIADHLVGRLDEPIWKGAREGILARSCRRLRREVGRANPPSPEDDKRSPGRLLDAVGMEEMALGRLKPSASATEEDFADAVEALGDDLKNYLVEREVVAALFDLLCGLGPLEAWFLGDDAIEEALVCEPGRILLTRPDGTSVESPAVFPSERALLDALRRALAQAGVEWEKLPELAAAGTTGFKLPRRLRVNVVLEKGSGGETASALFRKAWRRDDLSWDGLVESGTLSRPMADLLRGAAALGWSVVAAGGFGSGRSTLLELLADESEKAAPTRRIAVAERGVAELRKPASPAASHVAAQGDGGKSMRTFAAGALGMGAGMLVADDLAASEVEWFANACAEHGAALTAGVDSPTAAPASKAGERQLLAVLGRDAKGRRVVMRLAFAERGAWRDAFVHLPSAKEEASPFRFAGRLPEALVSALVADGRLDLDAFFAAN